MQECWYREGNRAWSSWLAPFAQSMMPTVSKVKPTSECDRNSICRFVYMPINVVTIAVYLSHGPCKLVCSLLQLAKVQDDISMMSVRKWKTWAGIWYCLKSSPLAPCSWLLSCWMWLSEVPLTAGLCHSVVQSLSGHIKIRSTTHGGSEPFRVLWN